MPRRLGQIFRRRDLGPQIDGKFWKVGGRASIFGGFLMGQLLGHLFELNGKNVGLVRDFLLK